MILERLTIKALRGIESPLEVEFAPGMTVVEGPNGSGKTSLCRALRELLWPHADPTATVESTWREDGHVWVGTLAGGKTAWTCDGSTGAKPDVPDPALSRCLLLRIDELLTAPDTEADTDLAEQIARELAGGYDIERVRSSDRYKPATLQSTARLKKDIEEAGSAVRRQEQLEAELASKEDRLPQLEADLGEADRLQRQIAPLSAAIELAQARVALVAAESAVARFPEHMDAIRAEDRQQLDNLINHLTVRRDEIERARASEGEAQQQITAAQLPAERRVPAPDLDRWAAAAQQLASAEAALAAARQRRDKANHSLAQAQDLLGPGPRLQPPDVTPTAVAQAVEALDELVEIDNERHALDRMLALIGSPERRMPGDVCRQGIRWLAEWLAQPDPQSLPAARYPTLVVSLFGVAAAAGLVGAVATHASWLLLFALLGAAGIAVALATRERGEAARRATEARLAAQKGYAAVGDDLAAPAAWGTPEVRARIDALIDGIASDQLAESKRQWRDSLATDLAGVDARRSAAQCARADLEQRLGIRLDSGAPPQLWLLRNLLAYRDAREALADASAEVESTEAIVSEQVQQLCAFLDTVGEPAVSNGADAQAAIVRVRNRSTDLAAALKQRDQARRATADAERALAETTGQIEAFFAQRYCAGEADFQQRMTLLAGWAPADAARQKAQTEIALRESALAGAPELLTIDESAARELLVAAERAEARYKELLAELADIRAAVRNARSNSVWADARAKADAVTEEMSTRRSASLLAVAGKFLLDRAEADHESSNSGVLHKASELFERFTSHKYSLRVVRNSSAKVSAASYRAYDVERKALRPLAELSGGTRVQLLLAARVAFATSLDVRMPLFFDEALKHSDPVRLGAIVSAMMTLAYPETQENSRASAPSADGSGAGRIVQDVYPAPPTGWQIVYLTNDPVETVRIEDALESAGRPSPQRVNLGEIRNLSDSWRGCIPAVPQQEAVPSPEGMTPDAYRRATRTPRWNPGLPVESLPMFYLLEDDLALLHRVLVTGLTTVGRWEHARDEEWLAQAGIDTVRRARIAALCRAVRAFADAWPLGRPRAVSFDALRDAGVSDTFRTVLWEIARENGYSAEALLQVIDERTDPRVSGFRSRTRDEMEQWLRDHDFLTEEPPLTHGQLAAAIQEASPEIEWTEAMALARRWSEWADRAAGGDEPG